MLNTIFAKQKEFMQLIRESTGDGPIPPLDVNNRRNQLVFKDYAWRFTEELVEASYATPDLYKEELIDALHFLTAICIFAGIDAKQINAIEYPCPKDNKISEHDTLQVIRNLSLAMHLLKNRPWVKSETETDTAMFILLLEVTYTSYMHALNKVMTHEEILAEYIKKNNKNKERFL